MKQPYLECGKIINLHGFRGDVKLESWCDSPAVLATLGQLWFRQGEAYVPRRVLHASVFRQFVLARLEGIFLDPVYTGKAFAEVLSLLREGKFPGERILFLHSGGAGGLFAVDLP